MLPDVYSGGSGIITAALLAIILNPPKYNIACSDSYIFGTLYIIILMTDSGQKAQQSRQTLAKLLVSLYIVFWFGRL